MYNLYIVRRTQIYLDERQVAQLRSAARASRRTVSEIIREAIDDRLARPNMDEQFDRALLGVVGLWSDRDDLGSTDDYLRKVRQDRRGPRAR